MSQANLSLYSGGRSVRRDVTEIIGHFIKIEKGGDEHIHHCLTCGRDKLSVNQGLEDPSKKNLYHCWHCGISGRVLDDHTFPIYTVHPQEAVTKDSEVLTSDLEHARSHTIPKKLAELLDKRGIGKGVIEPFRLSTEPGRIQNDRVAMPMRLGSKVCGYQCWRPSEKVKYKNEGQRGIAGEEIPEDCSHIVLTEGMFDAFKIWESLRDRYRDQTRSVLCTVGSDVTPHQVSELLDCSPEDANVYIAFDNDKLSAAIKIYNALRPYRNVQLALPPSGLGGDWDDIFRADPGWADKYWTMVWYRV